MEELNKFARKYKLTVRQAKFVLNYTGNGTQAARQAGYKGNDSTLAVQASRLLKDDKIIRALDRLTDRQSAVDSPKILTRNDLLAIWTEQATDSKLDVKDRQKAMDSLAKAQGIFIDRSQIISNVRVESLDKLTDRELLAELDGLLGKLEHAGVSLNIPKRLTHVQDDDKNDLE